MFDACELTDEGQVFAISTNDDPTSDEDVDDDDIIVKIENWFGGGGGTILTARKSDLEVIVRLLKCYLPEDKPTTHPDEQR